MTPDTTPQKPEWFELADGDAPAAQVTKVSKKLPAVAVLVTGAIIATGAFFANASEESHTANQVTDGNFDPGHDDDSAGTAPQIGDTSTATFAPHKRPNGPLPTASDGSILPPPPGGHDDFDDEDGEEHGDFVPGQRPPHREDGDHRERGGSGSAPTIPSATASPAAAN